MQKTEILKNIYWVGAVDWGARTFHGFTYSTKRGTSYNAYLIIDKKIALVDTVYGPFFPECLERIKEIIDPKKIDYIIANHVEIDHSGALPKFMEIVPKAKVICSQKGKDGLAKYFYGGCPPSSGTSTGISPKLKGESTLSEGGWDFQAVKTGDKISLGKRTLQFIEAAMIHWPDSMFTYCPEDSLLLSNDAFGQHLATSQRFADEIDSCVLWDEVAKYYANILMPFSAVIAKKLQELKSLKINMIATGHGVNFRDKFISEVIKAYEGWAKGQTKKKVVVIFETMWGSTEKMARAIVEGMNNQGIEIKLYNIAITDKTEIINDLLDAKGVILGSSTYDNNVLPTMVAFLERLIDLRLMNKIGAGFGSFGWTPKTAAKIIEEKLKMAKIEVVQPALEVKYAPSPEELKKCFEFGTEFAKKI